MNTNKLDELRRSAMFNFSLSSKELFHSNVLFWIYNQKEIDLSGPILSSLLPEVSPASESRKYKVFRERHNFDLYFEDTLRCAADARGCGGVDEGGRALELAGFGGWVSVRGGVWARVLRCLERANWLGAMGMRAFRRCSPRQGPDAPVFGSLDRAIRYPLPTP